MDAKGKKKKQQVPELLFNTVTYQSATVLYLFIYLFIFSFQDINVAFFVCYSHGLYCARNMNQLILLFIIVWILYSKDG